MLPSWSDGVEEFRYWHQNEQVTTAQSYEIKLPPRAILGFKILEIFSVEN